MPEAISSTVVFSGSHPLTDSEIDELYPEGDLRDAARAYNDRLAEAGALPAPAKLPCGDCAPCREKAEQIAAAENEGLPSLTE